MMNRIKELLNNMQIKRCPVCEFNRLWFKEFRHISNNTYNVLFKCDNCAYVNTTLQNPSTVSSPFLLHSASYDHFGVYVCTDGRTEPCDYLIGYDYWFNGSELKRESVRCPFCGEKSKVVNVNPFIRHPKDYRADISCRCPNNHIIAFGVHIPEEVFEVLNVRGRR